MRPFPPIEAMDAPEYSLATELMREMEQLRHTWAGMRPPPPLSRSDLMLMGTVKRLEGEGTGPVTAGRLAAATHQSAPGISQKLNHLEAGGYIRRSGAGKDRRVVAIRLTKKGEEAATKLLRKFMGGLQQALEEMGEEDARQLLHLMRRLGTAVHNLNQQEE